jgi:hypothetical protein
MVKIEPDGREGWAKIFDVPNMVLNDFHCDGTPYRFIQPTFKAMGATVDRGLPQTLLFALDYGTGRILYQTRFPRSLTGVPGLSDQKEDSLYVSTLGLQFAKGAMKGVASISRFNQQLELINAKEIIGAEASFPLLTCGPRGVNMLSYDFSKPFKGVGSAVNDNLEPIDVTCPWTRGLNLVMEHCSYSSTDVQCKEEPLDVEPGEGTATIGPGSFNLLRLALKLENGAEPAVGAQPVQRDPLPRPLGEPKPVAYRATSEINTQTNGPQFTFEEATKPKAGNISANPRDTPADARLNEVYSQLRHTLTSAEKEALKQEELGWLKKRERFSNGDPQWTELTKERIRELEARFSEKSAAPQSKQRDSDSASPNGQYLVIGNEPSNSGPGREIELKTTAGEKLLSLGSGAQLGFKAEWSADSKHLVVIVPGRFNGARNDIMVMAETVDGEWKTVDYTMPGGSEIRLLSWLSPDTVRLQSNSKVFTMQFPKPTTFVFRLGRFSDLTLETEPGSEKVTVDAGDKTRSDTVFESPLKPAGGTSYVSPRGTRFQLEKLGRPVINDANRKINSGDWKLIISGSEDEYLSLKEKIGAPAFGDTGKTEYFGAIRLYAEGK